MAYRIGERADLTYPYEYLGEGIDTLKSSLAGAVPKGPWLFPEDQLTDASLRQTAAEITREKLFLNLHQELPYALTVAFDPDYGEYSLHYSYNYPEMLKIVGK